MSRVPRRNQLRQRSQVNIQERAEEIELIDYRIEIYDQWKSLPGKGRFQDWFKGITVVGKSWFSPQPLPFWQSLNWSRSHSLRGTCVQWGLPSVQPKNLVYNQIIITSFWQGLVGEGVYDPIIPDEMGEKFSWDPLQEVFLCWKKHKRGNSFSCLYLLLLNVAAWIYDAWSCSVPLGTIKRNSVKLFPVAFCFLHFCLSFQWVA